MNIGISVFAGDKYDVKSNMEYIDIASFLGVSRIFTSFNAVMGNETDLKYAMEIIKYARLKNMNIMTDVSPKVFSLLGADLKDLAPFYRLGTSYIRCDYGFDAMNIAEMSKNDYGIGIVINASTVTQKEIEEILIYAGNIKNIKACHNFYPHPYTGLSCSFFNEKTKMLKEYGVEVSAFIPSQVGRRGPLYEGLPTIEYHRNMKPVLAARDLVYGNMIDAIYFGDAYASTEELEGVLKIDPDVVELEIELTKNVSNIEKNIIFSPYHINRLDASEYIVRSGNSRLEWPEKILPSNCIERNKYAVTIDNKGMGRYMGELQIVRQSLPSDPRVNVVGTMGNENTLLLDYIQPGRKFKFIRKGG